MSVLDLSFASGESSLSVRRFSVSEEISGMFSASVVARSPRQDLDLATFVGDTAALHIEGGQAFQTNGGARTWSGVVSYMEQTEVEPTGLSTYFLRIVPSFWLLTQRRNYRIFQHLSIPDIVDEVLSGWSITPAWNVARASYPKLEFKVQYGETDEDFVSRLLEEAGIAFTFADSDSGASVMTFNDTLHTTEARSGAPLPFVDNPNQSAEQELITEVRFSREVRPGALAIRDYDFRNPAFPLLGEAPRAPAPEDRYEQFHYLPGSFLAEGGSGGGTPAADDKGVARYIEDRKSVV